MFTQQTISALVSLQDLTYKSQELLSLTGQPHRSETRNLLLNERLSASLETACVVVDTMTRNALIEGLRKAKPEFAGTPFEQTMSDILAAYSVNSEMAELCASVALSGLQRQASDWLKAQAEAALPVQTYSVGSAFGRTRVEATSPENARLVAAAQHHKCAIADLDGGQLRSFSNGVVAA